MARTDRPPVGRQPAAIRSALTVLEQVARAGPGVTARELSSALGLSPATTYRLGKLLLANQADWRAADLRRLTPRTLGQPEVLERELDRVRDDQVARQFGELR